MIHRDIKSKNVLIELDGFMLKTVKLCDFGVSKVLSVHTNNEKDTTIGSTRYQCYIYIYIYLSPNLIIIKIIIFIVYIKMDSTRSYTSY